MHALARVLLHGAIKNLQVSWVKLGFDVSLACLNAGANDFSGTLMEESISKAAGATFGEYVSPEEFRRMIRSIGRVPAERTTTYKIRRVFDAPEGMETAHTRHACNSCKAEKPCALRGRRVLTDSHARLIASRQRSAKCQDSAWPVC